MSAKHSAVPVVDDESRPDLRSSRGAAARGQVDFTPGFKVHLAPVIRTIGSAPADVIPGDRPAWQDVLAYQLHIWRRQWQHRLRTPWLHRTDWPIFSPLVAIALLTVIFRTTNLDVTISRWFYDPAAREWPWLFSLPCEAFYRLGIFPPFILAVSGCFLWIGGHLFEPTGTLRRAGLFLVLLMIIGPGLIVNLGFKEFWGRARPNQIQEFGGPHEFAAVGLPGSLPGGNSSFPSGHASIAFYMMAPGFLAGRRRPQLAAKLFLGGVAFGLCMSATRVIQGAHFASDVFWAGAIVYFTGVALSRLVLDTHSERGALAP